MWPFPEIDPTVVFHEMLTKLAPKWDESFLNMELLFEGFDSRGDQVPVSVLDRCHSGVNAGAGL